MKSIKVKKDTQNQDQGSREIIYEAIERILLDIVIRGHGDRLIGRWSREPRLQEFLDQVPYMLDRINQLHLACCRSEHFEEEHVHHYHQHHHHHQHQHNYTQGKHQNRKCLTPNLRERNSLTDLISLIGNDMHWLVRTRDPLGLTPLHKAVLHNNRPIVEYIVDRYQDEFAPVTSGSSSHRKLIDTQDKYGRTPLHYAASIAIYSGQHNPLGPEFSRILYDFLVSRGAARDVKDFRSKKAIYYLENPDKLLVRSILHLANKLNASFQASVLTKTLRASRDKAIRLRELELLLQRNELTGSQTIKFISNEENNSLDQLSCDRISHNLTEANRTRDISASCNDLSHVQNNRNIDDKCNSIMRARSRSSFNLCHKANDGLSGRETQNWFSDIMREDGTSNGQEYYEHESEQKLRQLISDRVSKARLDKAKKSQIMLAINEGDLEQLNELLIEGHGQFMSTGEVLGSCWNQQCKRYLRHLVPNLLARVDSLHEAIALNQHDRARALVIGEPILVRVLRPYKRAAMNSLHVAIFFEQLKIVDRLMRDFPELITASDSNGATSLHYAARKLHLNKLYCWLLEHYGSQLEQVRDSRNRTAQDYRQQAIRLSNYSSSSERNLALTISKSVESNQLPQIKVCGKHMELAERRENSNQTNKKTRGTRVKASKVTELVPENNDIIQDKQSERNGQAVEAITSTSTTKINHNDDAAAADDDDDDNDALTERSNLRITCESPSNDNSNCTGTISPGMGSRLESTIVNSIRNGDKKFLEHLIIANRGNVILKIYNQMNLESNENRIDIDESMRDFLENYTPNYIETINCVHKLIHECYSNFTNSSSHLPNANENNFLRLCNLFSNKRLVMSRDQWGASPLHISILKSDNRLVEYILRLQPEAASAPDLQGRTPIHLAAIASAAYTTHGSIKLTRKQCSNISNIDNANTDNIDFWLVDSTIDDIFEKLKERYTDLLDVEDKYGMTATQYYDKYTHESVQHVNLNYEPGLINSDALLSCCEVYSKLLSRYNYYIIVDSVHVFQDILPSSDCDDSSRSNDLERKLSSALSEVCSEVGSSIRKTKRRNKQLANKQQESHKALERTHSCDTNQDDSRESKGKRLSCKANRQKASKSASSIQYQSNGKKRDSLLSSLEGDLSAPISHVKRHIQQVAPKPTVGSEAGFPLVSRSPTNLNISNNVVSNSNQQKQREDKNQDPVIKPFESIDLNENLEAINDEQEQYRLLRRRNDRTEQTRYHPSVVGGVIVPSIIHDEKSGEIETYDVIYRQPPISSPAQSRGPSRQQLHLSITPSESRVYGNQQLNVVSGNNKPKHRRRSSQIDSETCSNDSNSELDIDHDDNEIESDGQFSDDDNNNNNDNNHEKEIGNDSSDSDDSGDIHGDEERVERLSSEFDARVSREKDELRSKVDSIMNEIRSSSKLNTNLGGTSGSRTSTSWTSSTSNEPRRPQSSSSCTSSTLTSSNASRMSSSRSSNSIKSKHEVTVRIDEDIDQVNSPSRSISAASSRSTTSSSKQKCKIDSKKKDKDGKIINNNSSKNNTTITMNAKMTPPKNAYGQTYLHFICSKPQNSSSLYKVLMHAPELIGERDIYYRTMRDVAVQFNLPNNVIVIDEFIIDAFIRSKVDLLRNLLNQGYSPLIHVSDPDGNDIMLILKLLKLEKMIQLLLQMADFQRWRDELHTFIRHGYSAGVHELIQKHNDLVRSKSMHSRTSLHLAVLFSRHDIVGVLLAKDPSSVHVTDCMGRTALHYAYGLRCAAMASIRDKLISHGADEEARDVKMRIPAFYSIFCVEIEDIKRIELELN